MEEKLPINSLDRFRKRSTKLKLEYIDHGDAPVGCGGAVLRWVNPSLTRSLHLVHNVPETAIVTLDGKIIDRNLLDFTPGKHVYAAQIWASEVDPPVLLFMLRSNQVQNGIQPSMLTELPIDICSGNLAGWSWSLLESADTNWRHVEFDASGWKPVVRDDQWSCIRPDDYRELRINYYQKLGLISVGPPKPWAIEKTYCIRFEFEIPHPVIIPDEE